MQASEERLIYLQTQCQCLAFDFGVWKLQRRFTENCEWFWTVHDCFQGLTYEVMFASESDLSMFHTSKSHQKTHKVPESY